MSVVAKLCYVKEGKKGLTAPLTKSMKKNASFDLFFSEIIENVPEDSEKSLFLSISETQYSSSQSLTINFDSYATQWEESFFPKTSVAIVILFWLKWAGYLAVAGLNLLAQLFNRRSPFGV